MNMTFGHILKSLKTPLRWFFGSLLAFLVITTATTTIIVLASGDGDYAHVHDNRIINDVTQLNPIEVSNIITPESLEEIVAKIRGGSGPVSIGGGRFSQGGQAAYHDSLHFDMRKFNHVINLDPEKKEITVQAGITWRDIQEYIDPYNFSVKIMQTYANFTVGGSLSVNSHGRYLGEGPLVKSVRSIKIVLADGSIINAAPDVNADIFYGAIGGYGGLGIIVEATLQLTDNEKVKRVATAMPVTRYKDHFFKEIRNDKNIIFHNADIYPPAYEDVMDVSWYRTDDPLTDEERLTPRDKEYSLAPKVTAFVADYDFGKTVRQYVIDSYIYSSDVVVWRNKEASYDVKELEPTSRAEKTYALREYFIPVENFDIFVPKMREIFQRNGANILNVSIRHAHKDPGTLLAWARNEVFAFVVYYQQGTTAEAKEKVKAWSIEMVNAAIDAGGTYYLPYQVYMTQDQFERAYPRANEYFKLKERLDPDNRFINQLWAHHYPKNRSPIEDRKQILENYFRREEQTFLTIPEWYLVFNPQEYADFLDAGNNPSDFPFMSSIQEYWTLYDRVTAIADSAYPRNDQYITVLRVIGISTTIEYMYKGIYENVIGRFTRWLAGNQDTPEDLIIRQAQRAYSELIYDKAWYEFDFWPWVQKIWSEPVFLGPNIIRKLERKLFFSLEYGFKTIYAKLIELGAKTAYKQSDGLIYLTVSNRNPDLKNIPEQVEILEKHNKRYLISVPRWGGFTEVIPKLANQNFDFDDISGNNEIVVTYNIEKAKPFSSNYSSTLFESSFVSNPKIKRLAVLTKVKDLKNLILESQAKGYKIEHIFDY
jgi:FAD/FMN-containing dehydrogenase